MKVNMRVLHRYLGFFLAGILAVYALSGMVLIFRETDFLKQEQQVSKSLEPNLNAEQLGKALRIKNLRILETKGTDLYFESGTYNSKTGEASYTTKDLPFILKKLTRLHKATTDDPLYWLNIFFGCSLLFMVISSFWMYRPKTQIFRKGLYFTVGGILLVLLMLFV